MFHDHFSHLGEAYSNNRPTYPPGLFVWLASIVKEHSLAWDCGTGSGQAAVALVEHFERVIATDGSAEQIRSAAAHPKVEYRVAPAAASTLPDHSADLITVAQALHWFATDRFNDEVHRVGKTGCVFAAIGYSGHRVNAAVDAVQDRFEELVTPFWPPERALLEAGYRTIPFPFREIPAPAFQLTARWSLATYLGYLKTWSALMPFLKANGYDPVDKFEADFTDAWGDPAIPRRVSWALHLRAGYCDGNRRVASS